ncbi:MAG: hypothetical protein EB120_10350, partial [Proteobacteria bacterium]|nr:hypothetical protein [Pseudomonadota bacterium]
MSPSTANETDTFEHWLNRQFSAPLLNAEDRLRIASTFRRTELNTQDWLSTVELMREALILNSEQVTLCFSSLPRTKKNRALLDCFNFYLQSPLADDRMARIWNILGQLKSHAFTLSDELPLTFVPAEPSSYLFREFCNSIQYFPQNSKVDISSFDHLGLATSHGMSEVFSGNSIGAMESLCDALISNFHSCNKPVILHFFGKPQSLTWIKLRLAQAKIRFQVCWDTPTSYSPNFFTNLIASVRTTTHLPLIERLQIAHNLSQHPAYFGENQQDYFDRVLHSRAVSTEQIEFLQTLNPIELREPLTEFPQVLIFPLVNTPVLAGFDYFSFSDDSLLEPPTMHHLLSESELESLFYAGFQVPRWTETLQSRMAILKSHASRFHEKVFTSLKEEHLDG